MSSIADIINEAFEQRGSINAGNAEASLKEAVNEAIAGLDRGRDAGGRRNKTVNGWSTSG